MALALLGAPAMKHLNGVFKQSATTCLMTTETGCVPKNGAVSNAFRGSKQFRHAGLDRASRQGLACPSKAAV